MNLLKEHKTQLEINAFSQILIQQTIEQAIELKNPTCTIQLRNIVYIHNQLVKYGADNIFIKGFQSTNLLDKNGSLADTSQLKDNKMEENPPSQGSDEDSDESEEEEESANSDSEGSDDGVEMDPVKMIMEALGNQFIILKVYVKEFITQQTLNKSINFVIRTRIFENYNEIVRCSDCNAITCEGMLPRRRFIEGLKMKQW